MRDNITEAEWAWVAGVIEGEGCLRQYKQSTGDYYQISIMVRMTDFDVIDRLQQYTGVGRVFTAKKYPGRKQLKCWEVGRREDIRFVLKNCRKWFGNRRGAKADSLLASMPDLIPYPVEKIREMKSMGMSYREIGKEVGLCYSTVCRVHKNGLCGFYRSVARRAS